MKTEIRSMQFNLCIALWRKYNVVTEINEWMDDPAIMYVRLAVMEELGGHRHR